MNAPIRQLIRAICLGLAALTFGCSQSPTTQSLVQSGDGPRLRMGLGERELVAPTALPLFTKTECDVSIDVEPSPEGCLIHYTIANPTDRPLEMPELALSGVRIDRDRCQAVENWKSVRFVPSTNKWNMVINPWRSYPRHCYSPVMGLRTDDLFIGAALLYEPFETGKEVRMEYAYNEAAKTWTFHFRLLSSMVKRDHVKKRFIPPPPTMLEPGRTERYTLAVGVADPEAWVTAYRAYRDFFRETYGSVRYEKSLEPVYVFTMGIGEVLDAETNPKGYLPNTSGDRKGRLDLRGWRGFSENLARDIYNLGYCRMMIKQVAGGYIKHREASMVFEITSSWSPVMYETADELQKVADMGMRVGFWWGRAASISEGFDTGLRHPFDPYDEEDWRLTFRELDRAYDMGVRLIGCDDLRSSIFEGKWWPSSEMLFEDWFPVLTERYPGMKFAIEPAACDYLHLWGPTYVHDRYIGEGSLAFANYIVPGNEFLAVMRRNFGQKVLTVERMEEFMRMGFTPYVYAHKDRLPVNRELLHRMKEKFE